MNQFTLTIYQFIEYFPLSIGLDDTFPINKTIKLFKNHLNKYSLPENDLNLYLFCLTGADRLGVVKMCANKYENRSYTMFIL